MSVDSPYGYLVERRIHTVLKPMCSGEHDPILGTPCGFCGHQWWCHACDALCCDCSTGVCEGCLEAWESSPDGIRSAAAKHESRPGEGFHIWVGGDFTCKECGEANLYCDDCDGFCCACLIGHCDCCGKALDAAWTAEGCPDEWDQAPYFGTGKRKADPSATLDVIKEIITRCEERKS